MENNHEKKQTVLSLIQPTGTPTLGNYLGALKNWKNMSDGYDRYIFQLAGAFLTSQDFQMPYVPIAKEGQHIIQRALEAAEVIETVFNAE